MLRSSDIVRDFFPVILRKPEEDRTIASSFIMSNKMFQDATIMFTENGEIYFYPFGMILKKNLFF